MAGVTGAVEDLLGDQIPVDGHRDGLTQIGLSFSCGSFGEKVIQLIRPRLALQKSGRGSRS